MERRTTFSLIDVAGQRQLDKDAVDRRVGSQGGQPVQQLGLGGGFGQAADPALDAAGRAVAFLAADIHLAGGVLPHQQHGQAGGRFAPLLQGADRRGGLLLDLGGQNFSVNDGSAHSVLLSG